MRPDEATAAGSTLSADFARGALVFALCTALIVGLAWATHYVTGAIYVVGAAALAWRNGPRPAWVASLLSAAAIGPLSLALDIRGDVSLPVRILGVAGTAMAVSWICGSLHDANQRLLVEGSRLRESETVHRLIGALAADFAFHARIDPGGQIIVDSATPGLSGLLGYTPDDLQGRPALALVHPDDRGALEGALGRAGSGEEVHGGARVRARDGRLIHVEYRAQPVRRPDGSLASVVCAIRDVTREREQQTALAEQRQRLLMDASEREQVEARLRRATNAAERRADASEEARAALRDREQRLRNQAQLKDQFLATLSHELRNPLAPLRNVVEILRMEPLSKQGRRAVGVMDRQITQLVRLTDDLMDVSRITRGQVTLRREPVDVRRVIDTAVEAAQPQLTGAGLALTIDTPDRACLLDADATRIAQVLLNLLSNAAKFTATGGRVAIIVAPHADTVSITVRDSGIGIPLEDQERVFGMFVQLNSDIRRGQSGLGIGLTLVKQMVELHGGSVSVHSAGRGQGSEFTITLPLAAASAEMVAAAPPAPRRRGAAKIVVVDDSRDGADGLVFLLKAAGHDVKAAYDGGSAIHLAEQFRPDVMLLDIGMPDVSGYDVALAIRGATWGRAIRLIALTGWSHTEHRRRSLEAGFDAHLVKPVELATVEDVLYAHWAAPHSDATEP